MNLDQTCRVELGERVRLFFEEDLRRIPPGFCFLPEWICHSMTEAALRSHHEMVLYPVKQIAESSIPLQTDWDALLRLLNNYSRYQRDLIILSAFPAGYIDHGIGHLNRFAKQRCMKKIHIFMDLAQSYGCYDFLSDLDWIRAIYISFNGRKLISCGGALRIEKNSSGKKDSNLNEWQTKIGAAVRQQEKDWVSTWALIQNFGWDGQDLIRRLNAYNLLRNRSSYHRTALLCDISSSMGRLLIHEGFGQTIHPCPQQGLWQMSPAYEEWKEKILMLFPKPRTELRNCIIIN